MQTPFHAYYTALKLNSLHNEDRLLPVFSEGNINVYPYQVAAALFAMRNPYQKGVILCDEAGMGKSHEAMLILSQGWYEGKTKLLIAIPNPDLLMQWAEMIEEKYSLPFCIAMNDGGFDYDGIVLTTYDYLTQNIEKADRINWDIIVFEEANALSSVYQEENAFRAAAGGKQAKILKKFAENTFKILLTGTPIEKNIMDLYGLIYFIDEELLPDPDTYMKRYLRKPENYPELAEKVSKYCFRTLRSQAKQYAKIPERRHITLEYEASKEEKEVYNLLFAYVNKPQKIAFSKMEQYDLALMLLGLLSSSTAAAKASFKNIIKRLEETEGADTELAEFRHMLETAEAITEDEKAKLLLMVLDKLFPILKKTGANGKAVIFTESVETQKYLLGLLKDKYRILIYNGQSATDYTVIKQFKEDGEILISTDNGAKGYNLEEASLIINYDLLYNTLKMEQRIDRIHRINQQNDCIVVSFINKENFADVRKLELVSKRHILSDGVFGVSDSVIGGFTDNFDKALKELTVRTKIQVEKDYQKTLNENEIDNRQLVESAESILFTTFTKEISDKIKISPQYVEQKSKEINGELWELVKYYFEEYNNTQNDCRYKIDDEKHTVTATNYEKLPMLFYYPTNTGNKPYTSLKEFKKISLLSPLAKGIIFNLGCADFGTMQANDINCTIALYLIKIYAGIKLIKEYPVLIGVTDDNKILTHNECELIMNSKVCSYSEEGNRKTYWLRDSKPHKMDLLLNLDEHIAKEEENLTPLQQEEVERMKLAVTNKKNNLNHALDDFELRMKELNKEFEAVRSDRLKLLMIERKISALKNEIMKKKEGLFFDEMQIDVDLENKINEFLGREKISANAERQFVINVGE
ncbi:MAG: RNA polymerase-associated protein RapA [Firmicutes bacterium ADurb.Bin193]|nr:MAG: RNA polymerase-associated protein RapA [Firmicutes bacterium ADurb.Bin193]